MPHPAVHRFLDVMAHGETLSVCSRHEFLRRRSQPLRASWPRVCGCGGCSGSDAGGHATCVPRLPSREVPQELNLCVVP